MAITTDHISPAGEIKFNSLASKYLSKYKVNKKIIILLDLEEEIMKLCLEVFFLTWKYQMFFY